MIATPMRDRCRRWHRGRRGGLRSRPDSRRVPRPARTGFSHRGFGPILAGYRVRRRRLRSGPYGRPSRSAVRADRSLFATDRRGGRGASEVLRYEAGHFYHPRQADRGRVGQQPSAGQDLRPTNDKAGSDNHRKMVVAPHDQGDGCYRRRSTTYPQWAEMDPTVASSAICHKRYGKSLWSTEVRIGEFKSYQRMSQWDDGLVSSDLCRDRRSKR